MTVIGYMDSRGVFRESVQEGSAPVGVGLVVAPPGWGQGLRWTGAEWIEDDAPAIDRAGMVADKWQVVAILDLMDPALWQRIADYAEGLVIVEGLPPCDPVTRSAIRNAVTIPRESAIVDLLARLLEWPPEAVDALFLQAMALRG